MPEQGASSQQQNAYVGSGDDEERSLEGSVQSMTDESASVLRASDSDSSSIVTRHAAAERGKIWHNLTTAGHIYSY